MNKQSNIEHILPPQNAADNKKNRAGTICITVLLGIAIALCVLVMSQVLSKGYLTVGGYSVFRVITGSMEPEIPTGALLVVQKTPMEEIKEKDIVTFRSREAGRFDMIITHRVISVYEGADRRLYLETKGDANQYADGQYVDETYLIGKVIYHTKEGNVVAGILSVLTSKMGFLACIVLPCLLIGAFVMRDCLKTMRKELDAMNREIAKEQKEKNEESYEEMRERLRQELLKELNQSAEQPETIEQAPSTEQ